MLNIPVVLGSATPSLESLHNVDLGRYRKLQLPLRAGSAEMPSFHLIDMRGQNTQQGISIPLQQVIKQHLAADNQVLVFLNRRGFAPTLLCTSCGWQAHCSDCDARLTLHQSPPQMSCHHCGLHFPIPNSCESCHAKTLTDVGVGTQKIEAGLSQMFSGTPIYRVDRDTIRTSRQLDLQLQKINAGASAILVGTQMLAKGHHFPNVTLVAILNADSGFCSPDFRAPERTAQTIVQVAGRAGRAEKTGQVWIQSYQPENPTLQMLINAGYPGFAEFELSQRKLAHFPPFQPMSIIRAESPQAELAQQFLTQVQQTLKHNSDCEILGPVPAPLARQANRWRYQLLLLANNRQQMHQTLQRLDLSAQPRQVRWSVDVDPYDSL